MLRNRSGFTLIELLVVVAILGVLASLALPKFASTRDKAKLAAVRTDIRNLETIEESYFSNYGTYGSLSQLQADGYAVPPGVTMLVNAASNAGYTLRGDDASIGTSITGCTVVVGGGLTNTMDGVITCP
jgi:prepilin-type N-terminal cleavage/methylation domain-containing protein